MVVDDSIMARTLITQGLTKDPQIEVVGTGFNARDAMSKVAQLQPDVMTLDVEMPGMSGIDFLKELLPKRPLPVILVSSLNLRGRTTPSSPLSPRRSTLRRGPTCGARRPRSSSP